MDKERFEAGLAKRKAVLGEAYVEKSLAQADDALAAGELDRAAEAIGTASEIAPDAPELQSRADRLAAQRPAWQATGDGQGQGRRRHGPWRRGRQPPADLHHFGCQSQHLIPVNDAA